MKSSVKLLKKSIKLNFEEYISNICKKASNQLNAICRLQTFMGHKGKETMINTFVHSNFSLPVLVFGISVLKSLKLQNKVEKIHERSLKFPVTSLERKQAFGEKNKLHPCWKFCKIVWHPNKTHGNSIWVFLEHPCLGNSTSFLIDPWNFHMLFLQYPSKFHVPQPLLLCWHLDFFWNSPFSLRAALCCEIFPTYSSHFTY